MKSKSNLSDKNLHKLSIQNISEEIRDLTAKDIGQKLGTLGRHMGHWADIKNIKQTLSGNWGHWADIGQKLGRHLADIGQTLGRHWADIGVLHISYKTFCTSHPR